MRNKIGLSTKRRKEKRPIRLIFSDFGTVRKPEKTKEKKEEKKPPKNRQKQPLKVPKKTKKYRSEWSEKSPEKRFLKSQSAEQEAPPLNAKIPLQMERKKAPKKEVAKPRTNKNNGL